MKNYRIYLTLILCTLALASCSKEFLDAEPITEVTDSNFYQTPEDAY